MKRTKKTFFAIDTHLIVLNSICVDASCSGNPGKSEYRAKDMKTGKILFQRKYEYSTNNLVEFMAIVHAIAFIQNNNLKYNTIYSDSLTSIAWVTNKKYKTKIQLNEQSKNIIFDCNKAIQYLKNNPSQIIIRHWQTKNWGEIPADYNRK